MDANPITKWEEKLIKHKKQHVHCDMSRGWWLQSQYKGKTCRSKGRQLKFAIHKELVEFFLCIFTALTCPNFIVFCQLYLPDFGKSSTACIGPSTIWKVLFFNFQIFKVFFSLFIFFFYLLQNSFLYLSFISFHFYFLSFFGSFTIKISESLEFKIQTQQKIPKPDFNSNNRFQQIPKKWEKKKN